MPYTPPRITRKFEDDYFSDFKKPLQIAHFYVDLLQKWCRFPSVETKFSSEVSFPCLLVHRCYVHEYLTAAVNLKYSSIVVWKIRGQMKWFLPCPRPCVDRRKIFLNYFSPRSCWQRNLSLLSLADSKVSNVGQELFYNCLPWCLDLTPKGKPIYQAQLYILLYFGHWQSLKYSLKCKPNNWKKYLVSVCLW